MNDLATIGMVTDQIAQVLLSIKSEMEESRRQYDAISATLHYLEAKRAIMAKSELGAQGSSEQVFEYLAEIDAGTGPRQMVLDNREDRVKQTIMAAVDLAKYKYSCIGSSEFEAKDVENWLHNNGIALGVTHPTSVISTILTGDKILFRKTGAGLFEYAKDIIPEDFGGFGPEGVKDFR
jgi:hypothetical protein